MNFNLNVLLLSMGTVLIASGYVVGVVIFHSWNGALIVSLGFMILTMWMCRTLGRDATQEYRKQIQSSVNEVSEN